MLKKIKEKKINNYIKFNISKYNLYYILIAFIDIVFMIYAGRHNYANYVTSKSEGSFFVGDSKDLLFGKNYITLIFTSFIYIYILLSNKIIFQKNNTKKNMLKLLILLLLANIILFFIFTKRIY